MKKLLAAVALSAASSSSDECDATCMDTYESCYRWAREGNCESHPEFTREVCALSCGVCKGTEEPVNPCESVADAVSPGSVARTLAAAATGEKATYVNTDPPIVVIDDFLAAAEAAELASLSEQIGFGAGGSSCAFKRSTCNSASMSCLPVSDGRCWRHEAMRSLEERMLGVVGVPSANCEPLRFFRYHVGETFGPHHDAAGQDVDPHTPGGPRVWTLYVFLQAPEEGGEFEFPQATPPDLQPDLQPPSLLLPSPPLSTFSLLLRVRTSRAQVNVSIPARAGRAVLWPHMLDGDLRTPDLRTEHAGRPVRAGVKYGVNLHAHRNALRTHVLAGCPPAARAHVQHTFSYDVAEGGTMLHDVIGLGATGAITRLLQAGADVNAADVDGMTPLHLAAFRGQHATVRALIDAGADAAAADSVGMSALHHAAWQGMADVAELLVRHQGADPNGSDNKGITPLHLAARYGHASAARALLVAGAAIGAASRTGETPLHDAAKMGEAAMITILVELGADAAAIDQHKATPLHTAAKDGHADAARALAYAGAPLDAAAARGLTALHIAAALGQDALVHVLLSAGASADARDDSGATALVHAARQGHVAAAAHLCEAGADLGAVDRGGSTALHVAAWKGHAALVGALVEAGAATKKRDASGATPLAVARRFGHAEVVALLEDAQL